MNEVSEKNQEQSAKSKSGYDFQDENYYQIVEWFKSYPRFKILHPGGNVYPLGTGPSKLHCLTITTNHGAFIGDADIVIYDVELKMPVVIVSCKTSLKERLPQTLYYSRLYREKYPSIIVCLVTKDLSHDFGTVEQPRKPRILAEKENLFVYSKDANTSFGGCVYSFGVFESHLKGFCRVIR